MTNDGLTSSRPGSDETLVKRSFGRTLVDGKSKIARQSNINEATGSPQPSPGWLPNEVANFQSMSDQPSDVPIYCLFTEAKPFVSGRKEHGTPKQQTANKRRSRRRRGEAMFPVRISNELQIATFNRQSSDLTGQYSAVNSTGDLMDD